MRRLGRPIPPAHLQATVFERYEQAHGGGTGLGLAIVQAFVLAPAVSIASPPDARFVTAFATVGSPPARRLVGLRAAANADLSHPSPHLTRDSPAVAVPAQNALHSGHLGVCRPRKRQARVKCCGKVPGDAS